METNQTLAPDFGEPWEFADWNAGVNRSPGYGLLSATSDIQVTVHTTASDGLTRDKDCTLEAKSRAARIVAAVNACVGMADPAKEIQAMRDAIAEAFAALDSDALWAFDNNPPKELEARWYDGKGSVTSGPNNCLAFFERRKSALAKLQPHLPAK